MESVEIKGEDGKGNNNLIFCPEPGKRGSYA
jgi:hypothetical protein